MKEETEQIRNHDGAIPAYIANDKQIMEQERKHFTGW